MKIKIIANGNSIEETKVINAETGEQIENVVALELIINAQTYQYDALIRIRRPLVEAELEVRKVCNSTLQEIQ